MLLFHHQIDFSINLAKVTSGVIVHFSVVTLRARESSLNCAVFTKHYFSEQNDVVCITLATETVG